MQPAMNSENRAATTTTITTTIDEQRQNDTEVAMQTVHYSHANAWSIVISKSTRLKWARNKMPPTTILAGCQCHKVNQLKTIDNNW